jgi:phosphoribosylamine---glycine ligase
MRFLGVGDYADLGDLYLRLMTKGHEVRVHVADPRSAETFAGLIERVDDWRAELPWVRAAGQDGIILFETADAGPTQDTLRRDGYNVIGGGAFGDRLENDRAFGQSILRKAGIATVTAYEFDDFVHAIDFVRRDRRRYVYKPNGSDVESMQTYIGEMEDGEDVVALLEINRRSWQKARKPSFILMAHVSGAEVGIGAYFNGETFLDAVCIDWEHKRFFDGDRGELTSEMGTLVSYRGAGKLFQATLARVAPWLERTGYCGYINLNTIVNDDGIWPLEFTSRFGYPGFAILDPLHDEGWDVLFSRMIRRDATHFATHPGYAVGVVLTVPPFPYQAGYAELSKGLPILFRGELSAEDRRHLHYSEVALVDGQLVTAGMVGQAMVVTGSGDTVEAAQRRAYALAERVVVPNLRYRTDIGDRFLRRDRAEMERLGLL